MKTAWPIVPAAGVRAIDFGGMTVKRIVICGLLPLIAGGCASAPNYDEELQPWVAGRREELLSRRAETERALRAESILSSREYAGCLYPEGVIREFFSQAASQEG